MPRALVLFVSIGALTLALALLPFLLILRIGINDAEHSHLVRTGLPSHPERITWSPWTDQGLDAIHVLAGAAPPQSSAGRIVEARYGKCSNAFFTFGFYQAKTSQEGGSTTLLPAYGPNAWAKISLWPSTALAAFGILLLFATKKHPTRRCS